MGYYYLKEVVNINDIPSAMKNFEVLLKRVVLTSICDDYIKSKLKAGCDTEILNKGLETIVIYLIESSKKNLNALNQATSQKEETAKKILNSKDLRELGKTNNFLALI